jgi:hypothetical protein
VSALIALIGSTSPKVLLYKDCASTALIGMLFLVSCVAARKPILFYIAQRYGTDGTHEGMAIFEMMWASYPDFRRSMYLISAQWAALFLTQAAATAFIVHDSTYSTAYTYDQILPVVATALGIAASISIGRYYRHRGEARAHARAASPLDNGVS